MLLTRKEMLDELRKQDEELARIFEERRKLSQMCQAKGKDFYDSMWKALYSDGNSHHTF